MMKKRVFAVSAFVSLLFLLGGLVSCKDGVFDDLFDYKTGTSSTWTFENAAYGYEYLDITVDDGGSPESFRLYPGKGQKVTWEDEGTEFRGNAHITRGPATTAKSGDLHYEYYDSIKTVQILNYYKD